MYQNVKRTCRAVVFPYFNLLFCGVVVAVAVVLYDDDDDTDNDDVNVKLYQ